MGVPDFWHRCTVEKSRIALGQLNQTPISSQNGLVKVQDCPDLAWLTSDNTLDLSVPGCAL